MLLQWFPFIFCSTSELHDLSKKLLTWYAGDTFYIQPIGHLGIAAPSDLVTYVRYAAGTTNTMLPGIHQKTPSVVHGTISHLTWLITSSSPGIGNQWTPSQGAQHEQSGQACLLPKYYWVGNAQKTNRFCKCWTNRCFTDWENSHPFRMIPHLRYDQTKIHPDCPHHPEAFSEHQSTCFWAHPALFRWHSWGRLAWAKSPAFRHGGLAGGQHQKGKVVCRFLKLEKNPGLELAEILQWNENLFRNWTWCFWDLFLVIWND